MFSFLFYNYTYNFKKVKYKTIFMIKKYSSTIYIIISLFIISSCVDELEFDNINKYSKNHKINNDTINITNKNLSTDKDSTKWGYPINLSTDKDSTKWGYPINLNTDKDSTKWGYPINLNTDKDSTKWRYPINQ